MAKMKAAEKTVKVNMPGVSQDEFKQLKDTVGKLAEAFYDKREDQRAQTRFEQELLRTAIQRMPENIDGKNSGKWCADFLDGFRKRLKELEAADQPTPTPDVPPAPASDVETPADVS